ncbi:hypothetical protein HY771_00630 [Candidatus Uhrbacteria bacterium]|nr:hypothetical protein [Candidatus Uhrbacteria bacterium]
MPKETWGHREEKSSPRPSAEEIKNKAVAIFADRNKAYLSKVIEAAIAAENMTADQWRSKYSDQYRQDRDTLFHGYIEEDFRTLQAELKTRQTSHTRGR